MVDDNQSGYSETIRLIVDRVVGSEGVDKGRPGPPEHVAFALLAPWIWEAITVINGKIIIE